MHNFVPAVAGVVVCGLSTWVTAAIVPTITFDNAAQYNGQFVETVNAANIGYEAATQSVLYNPSGNNGNSVMRYDTNPGDAFQGPADFLTETLGLTTNYSTFSATANGSTGLLTRIQANNFGILALLNITSTTTVQLRLWYGSDTLTNNAGTTFYSTTFNLANGTQTGTTGGTGSTNAVATSSPIQLTLTQTAAADPVFNLTISDAQGFVASTGNQAFTVNDTYNTAGSAGARLSLAQTGNTIRVDNFSASAIPEPATFTLLLSAAGLLVRRRRA